MSHSEALPPAALMQLERQCFGRPVAEVWEENAATLCGERPGNSGGRRGESEKQKLAMVLRWSWIRSNRLAMAGDLSERGELAGA